ncbi:hypothetical protein L249_5731 [Ophiocordyceps polyrhachis-furcata BCC 54312]|uniref:Small ribosomal subunit protein bS18m n=1 Tax=Ophiocordyceps polyrhachis-furcata BCC 54312 TaxID=1330021 RepID=A0A367KZU0_9HYPO|nr:hypothetical protein L249_5731 [Ophiocordyceps polyrhachis-furcata BCC 54312]
MPFQPLPVVRNPRSATGSLYVCRQIHSSLAPQQGYGNSSPSRLRNVGMKTRPIRPSEKYKADLIVERHAEKKRAAKETDKIADAKEEAANVMRRMHRRIEPGEVYSPHDLSPVEMWKWRRKSTRVVDVVDSLGLRPLDMYKNFSLIQDFTSSSGQIQHPSVTGLRPVNQRKVAKMIRRVQGMGIYPTIHDHPELLRSRFYPSDDKNAWESGDRNR